MDSFRSCGRHGQVQIYAWTLCARYPALKETIKHRFVSAFVAICLGLCIGNIMHIYEYVAIIESLRVWLAAPASRRDCSQEIIPKPSRWACVFVARARALAWRADSGAGRATSIGYALNMNTARWRRKKTHTQRTGWRTATIILCECDVYCFRFARAPVRCALRTWLTVWAAWFAGPRYADIHQRERDYYYGSPSECVRAAYVCLYACGARRN